MQGILVIVGVVLVALAGVAGWVSWDAYDATGRAPLDAQTIFALIIQPVLLLASAFTLFALAVVLSKLGKRY